MTRSIPDLILERYRLKELPEPAVRAVEAALAADPALRARLDALDRSDTEISAHYSPLIVLHDKPTLRRRLGLRSVMVAAVAAAAVTLVAVFEMPRTVFRLVVSERIKGDVGTHPALAMYRRTPSGSERLADGDLARPGDVLRLGYASGGRAFGVILSIDGRGAVTMHLPPGGDEAASLAPGKMVLLDAAYELDDAPRLERFYFITGTRPFKIAEVLAVARGASAAPDRLALPAGLEQVGFAVRKEARK
jgi:anti-sigma factor RsiW